MIALMFNLKFRTRSNYETDTEYEMSNAKYHKPLKYKTVRQTIDTGNLKMVAILDLKVKCSLIIKPA